MNAQCWLAVCLVMTACAEDPSELSTTTQALSVGEITSVQDRDLGPCPEPWTGTCHFYELYSTTPGGFTNPKPITHQYRPAALCDGTAYSSIPGVSDSAAITYLSTTQVNVAIRTTSPNPTCWLRLEYSARSYDIDPDPDRTDPAPSYTNVVGPVTKIPVTSATDVGVSGSPARQAIELVGTFPTGGTYSPEVTCDGAFASSQIVSISPSIIRISFEPRLDHSSCEIRVRRVASGYDFYSNTQHIRVGGQAPQFPSNLAVYYWGGYQPSSSIESTFESGVQQIAGSRYSTATGAGFRSARLRLHPGLRLAGSDTMGIDPAALLAHCPANLPRFLGCGITFAGYQQALNHLPHGTPTDPVHVVLTVYDAVSVGPYFLPQDWRITDLVWMSNPAHQQEVIAEYEELTYALYQTQQGTGRTFIIANWESDNQIYCGSMNAYTSTNAASCPNGASHFDAFKIWMTLRKQGIAAGIARATLDGYTRQSVPAPPRPPVVADGIEFNSYRILHEHVPSYRSTLWDIIPDVRPAYASYSAWESADRGTLDDDLAALKAQLAAHTNGTTQLIIGELGSGYGQPWHFAETVRAAYRARLPVTTLWQAFPTSVSGLLDSTGGETLTMRAIRDHIINYAATGVIPPQAIQIHNVVDRGIDSSSPPKRWFELYGSFPPSPGETYQGYAHCMSADGVGFSALAGTVGYYSTTQINLGLPNPTNTPTWCTFFVSRSGNLSPLFGPRRICPVSAPNTNPLPCP